jgi:hypothetical protein|tara:strand:+ start:3137 stop:3526 length:390 start_codon:yes stop_codon:yes gene_type:complete
MANITYIKDGENSKSQLIIDGVQVDSSDYGVASNIHAIQWNGSKGEIEYNDGKGNEEITDISSYDFETKHSTEKKAQEDAEAKAIADRTYAEKRQAEYPSIPDQLDDIYHNGIDAWKTTIKAVKDKYPK